MSSTDLTNGSDVIQPETLWRKQGGDAELHCSHTKGAGYYQMYWYRQLHGQTMKQMVYIIANTAPEFEPDFKSEKFSANKKYAEMGTFTVSDLQAGDNGFYFCAVSEHSDTDALSS